ncbi:E3 ubiquitin-protein ligase SH3RF2 [Microcaecilia unicolor]|uniref:RING-type E3 ubiquitin transferase n=1 Tax=Microcaecilia unicolor TaxID=1415580 RepID=A0A6P7YU54_9AMPH|nr:E3 ubiquitin-protein ligase SH3RF2 [Microcaecilia unicolor]
MEDLSILDLLKCPVCLEKLDVTAKVLPCQHTFCKPCLQRALTARKELKCPECRTPVFCSIEELPANLLLVRLLDGIRGGQTIVRGNSLRKVGGLYAQDSFNRSRDPKGLRPASNRLIQTAQMPMEGVPCAKALYNYRGHVPKDLRLSKGDVIILHQQFDDNWSQSQADGVGSTFPASSVQIIKQLPQPPLCKALYNFDLKDKDKAENNRCLAFFKDDVIRVIRRIDENWVEGKLGDKIGIFPLLFVEPNLPARYLLDTGKSNRSSTLSSIPSLVRKSSIRTKPTELPAFRKVQDIRRKSPRQFLITNALNTINKMVHSPEDRQSPDISAPVLISSSNPAVLAPGTDKELPSTIPSQFNAPTFAISGVLGQSSATLSLPNSQQHISANMCVALHPYIAQGPEEMDLQKGEGVRVLGKYQEGWLRGMSLVTGKTGVFPSNYVIPVFRRCQTIAESRIPSLPSSWNMSTASVSSQGSFSDSGSCRHFRSVFVPTAVIAPVRNTAVHGAAAQTSLRRGCSIVKKSTSLQRCGQPSSTFQMVGSLKRTPSAVVRPQQLQQQKSISQVNSVSHGPVETAARPNPNHDSLALVARGPEVRAHSAGSSAILEVKEPVARNEPPASAPPSILVKPYASKHSTEKQVKMVRFQACSPPLSKREIIRSSSSNQNGRTEPVTPETSHPEQDKSPEIPPVYHQGCSSAIQQKENRRPQLMKALSFPTKRNGIDN